MRTGPRSSTTMDVSRDKLPKDLVVLNQLDDDHSTPTGHVRTIGDRFHFELDVSEFAPEDVVITSSNNLIEVSAEKMEKDGTVTNTFSHTCRLPVAMDPMSLTASMGDDGILKVKGRREAISIRNLKYTNKK
uniref:SHSP domain-containing protein n=1 Tax=Gadus morhua TaxID=8049 RepID=A0A8C5F927_GADMO